MVPFPMTFTDP